MQNYLELLYELSDKERSVFLMHFILRRSQDEVAKGLKSSKNNINRCCKQIKLNKELNDLRDEIFEAFL
jgi:DNA-directed RNA polymerase specialized sigma24 family protein